MNKIISLLVILVIAGAANGIGIVNGNFADEQNSQVGSSAVLVNELTSANLDEGWHVNIGWAGWDITVDSNLVHGAGAPFGVAGISQVFSDNLSSSYPYTFKFDYVVGADSVIVELWSFEQIGGGQVGSKIKNWETDNPVTDDAFTVVQLADLSLSSASGTSETEFTVDFDMEAGDMLGIRIQTAGETSEEMSFDNVEIIPVPEPVFLSILGLGVLAFKRR